MSFLLVWLGLRLYLWVPDVELHIEVGVYVIGMATAEMTVELAVKDLCGD